MVANTVHAAGESAGVPSGTFAVALATATEAELTQVRDRLEAAGIAFSEVVEAAGPFAGQLMAIGVEPVHDRAPIRKVVSHLPLIK